MGSNASVRCLTAISEVVGLIAKQDGAEAACWAHNPKVGGSKPPLARIPT